MSDPWAPARPRRLAVAIGTAAAALLLVPSPAVSAPETPVTAVNGSSLGYWADDISLFGGAQPDTGPTPTATLNSSASNSPQAGAAPTGLVRYGPATLFSSDAIAVSASGNKGPGGFAASTANIQHVNMAVTQPTTGSEIFTAASVASSCTATASGLSRSATITAGSLYTDSGWDDGDAVYPEPASEAGGLAEHDPVLVSIPTSPAANLEHTGHIHLAANSTDSWRIVFNEQVTNPDGSSTVNALHEYFIGPILLGHMSLGRSTCGVTLAGG
ncbi:MAG: hypothetical protein ACRD0N_01370 [Acidimicrobiales bacterium]